MVYLSKKPTGQRVDGDVEVHSVSQSALSVTFGLGNVNMPLASTNKCLMVFQAQIINELKAVLPVWFSTNWLCFKISQLGNGSFVAF